MSIVAIGIYKIIVEGVKIIAIVFSVCALFINEIKILKSKGSKDDKARKEEKINCIICLEEINLLNYTDYIKLKCHAK